MVTWGRLPAGGGLAGRRALGLRVLPGLATRPALYTPECALVRGVSRKQPCHFDVAHALVRAASALLPTPGFLPANGCRDETNSLDTARMHARVHAPHRSPSAFAMVIPDGHLSAQDRFHGRAGDVGEPEMAALELECQPGVVDAQAVQNRRLHVVHVDRIVGDVVAVIVGLAETDARA